MKNKYFFLIGPTIIISCALFLTPMLRAEEGAKPAGKQDENAISERLLKLEKAVRTMSENQKKIEEKNSKIKTELANLRVWIYRR